MDKYFTGFLKRPEIAAHRSHFADKLSQRSAPSGHGDLAAWLATLAQLPTVEPSHINLDSNTLVFGRPDDLSAAQQAELTQALMQLSPWRKGPYRIFDTFIDTEWRSDWKWQRLAPHISPLKGRFVLDVGCGSGYHCWRILGAGAAQVTGIDPSMLFLMQYLAVQQYAHDQRFDFLPIGIEEMPQNLPLFDSVFSMGVLYHRRNPIDHLLELKNLLSSGGELILETLIVDDADGGVLMPEGRYAKMRNVWSIMTTGRIVGLLEQAGYDNIRCVDQNRTSIEEQRSTEWMRFHSLRQFLDDSDMSKTVEGYPAPKRGIFIAEKRHN